MLINMYVNWVNKMLLVFGISGLWGFVIDLIDDLVRVYCYVFIIILFSWMVYVGCDLCFFLLWIIEVVIVVLIEVGIDVIDCGVICILVFVYLFMLWGVGVVMIIGSYIFVDRNGLKFYVLFGEIIKVDEVMICVIYIVGYIVDFVFSGWFMMFVNVDVGFIDCYLVSFVFDILVG